MLTSVCWRTVFWIIPLIDICNYNLFLIYSIKDSSGALYVMKLMLTIIIIILEHVLYSTDNHKCCAPEVKYMCVWLYGSIFLLTHCCFKKAWFWQMAKNVAVDAFEAWGETYSIVWTSYWRECANNKDKTCSSSSVMHSIIFHFENKCGYPCRVRIHLHRGTWKITLKWIIVIILFYLQFDGKSYRCDFSCVVSFKLS